MAEDTIPLSAIPAGTFMARVGGNPVTGTARRT